MILSRVMIANRGEIASRIIRACHAVGLETVLAVSEADRDSLPARQAGRTVCIGPAASGKSYLNRKAIVAAALGAGADALHPGYGFLSESPELAASAPPTVSPSWVREPDHIRQMGEQACRRAASRGSTAFPSFPGPRR